MGDKITINGKEFDSDDVEKLMSQGDDYTKKTQALSDREKTLDGEFENLKERDLFLSETNNAKIKTRHIWQLVYSLPMYCHCERDSQITSQFLANRIVNIPSSVR